jgi:hypothetical protein
VQYIFDVRFVFDDKDGAVATFEALPVDMQAEIAEGMAADIHSLVAGKFQNLLLTQPILIGKVEDNPVEGEILRQLLGVLDQLEAETPSLEDTTQESEEEGVLQDGD